MLIVVLAIAFGGARLLTMIFRRDPGYPDNPVPVGGLEWRGWASVRAIRILGSNGRR